MIGVAVFALFIVMMIRSFWRPGVVIAPLLLYFAGKQLVQLSFPYFAEHTALLNYVVFGGVSLVWIVRAFSDGTRAMLRIPPEYLMHLVFFALAFISTLWSMDTDLSEHLGWVGGQLVLFAVVAPTLLASTRGISEGFQWLAWVGGAMCLTFLFAFQGEMNTDRLVLAAATGTGNDLSLNPLAVGSMGAYTLTAAALGVFPQKRSITLLRLLAASAGLVIAGRSSRGDLFGGIAAVGILGLIPGGALRGRKLLAALLAAAVFAGVLYYGLFTTSYWVRYQNMGEDVSVLQREGMLQAVLDYYYYHPSTWLFGAGWWSSFAIVGFYPHNGLVQALVEMGLLGALLWVASVLIVSTRGLRLSLLAGRTGNRSLAIVRPALGLMICALMSNMKAGDCVDPWVAFTLATVAQIVRRHRREVTEADLHRATEGLPLATTAR
jgi:O-antigen ligase